MLVNYVERTLILQFSRSCYELAIRRTHPKGPYAFLGYYFGGLLAFELAKRFEKTGDQVVFLGGVDNPPDYKSMIPGLAGREFFLDRLVLSEFCSQEEALRLLDASADITDLDSFFHFLHEQFSPDDLADRGLTLENALRWEQANRRLWALGLDSYIPEGRVSTYDEFYAPPHPSLNMTDGEWRDIMHGWKNHAEDANFFEVGGKHYDILVGPHLQLFQEQLNRAMEQRGA